jgi:hypothetical protein
MLLVIEMIAMKSLTRVSICFLTLLIAIFFNLDCHSEIRRQRTHQSEKAPCHKCSGVYSSAGPQIKEVPLAELIHNQEAYRGQIVRVRANLHNDAGYKALYAPGAKMEGEPLMSEFTDLSSYAACDGVEQILHEVAGINNWFDGSASVVVVGGTLDHFRQNQFGFEMMCVEQASAVQASMP